MIKKTIIIISIPLILLIAIFIYGNYKAKAPPLRNPDRLCTSKEKAGNKKRIICIGDSITHGRVSANYVEMISQRLDNENYTVINAGINSELSYNDLGRINNLIQCSPHYITVLIGTNDVNASMNIENSKNAIKNMNLPKKPGKLWFKENLTKICRILKNETKAKIALISIPPIGEDIKDEAVQRTIEYSKIIREVAGSEKVGCIPLNEKMIKIIRERKPQPRFQYKSWRQVMYTGIFKHFILKQDFDTISRGNGFIIITDFLHLNKFGASMVADEIINFTTQKN